MIPIRVRLDAPMITTARYIDRAVIVDLVRADHQPDYCVHGQTQCVSCGRWCWLGDNTCKAVAAGEAEPLCSQCAIALIPPENRKPVGHIKDHLRADGPH